MTENDLQLREAIEQSGHDEPQRMQPGLAGEAVDGSVQAAFEEGLDHLLRWCVRMQVDGDVERLRRLEDLPVLLIIQVRAHRVRIQDGAAQAEFLHTAFQLLGRVWRIERAECGEADQAIGMLRDALGKLVVGIPGERRRFVGLEYLHAG